MLEFDSVFQQVAVLLVACVAIGAVATLLRQPLIVAFIAAGVVVGPSALGLVEESREVELLATVGISLLLFVVGLKLDLGLIRAVGPVALATGLGQIVFTSLAGYLIALGLGMAPVTALYVAVALTFSSTVIIVKLLSDKGEADQLHGRIAIGFLIVQDIVVVLAMIVLNAIGGPGEDDVAREAALVVLRGLGLLGLIGVAMRWILPPVLHRLAHNPELLMLFAIAWAVGLAALGDLVGFSEEVGAFLAGVAIASTPYRDAIGNRLTSVRDFLILFFFIDLGAKIDLAQTGEQVGPALLLSLFVLVGNPIIVMIIMGAMGYRRRVSFLAGLTVAQISEFSLILAALGLSLGHIGSETVGLITTVGLVTIGLSTYLIYNSHWIFDRISPLLSVFERPSARDREPAEQPEPPEVVVIGLGRFGNAIVERLSGAGVRVLGVDFDPTTLRTWEERGVPVLYGDAEDPELATSLPLGKVRWVVSTVRRRDANLALLHALRLRGYRGRFAASADALEDAAALREAGVDRVILPFREAAHVTAEFLSGEVVG
jgi:Kef-type K+ transport system membrane component KefB